MQQFELAILDWIQANLRSPFMDRAVALFSSLNNNGEMWILLAIVLILIKKHRQAGLAVGAGLLTDLILCNLTLKPLIGRIRPFVVNAAVELLVEPPASAAFPSGHTASSFAAVGALWAMGNPLWKPAAVVAALMAASRLYLYVHWPTDVLAGIAVGWLCGWLGAKLVQYVAEKLKKRKK